MEPKIYPPDFNEFFLESLHENARKKTEQYKLKKFTKEYSSREREILSEYFLSNIKNKNRNKEQELIILKSFYNKQKLIMDTFYEEIKNNTRNIFHISKYNDCTFLHSINVSDRMLKEITSRNNVIIDHKKITPEQMIQNIQALNVSISGSVISDKAKDVHVMYPFGLIINNGVVQIASDFDLGSITTGIQKPKVVRPIESETNKNYTLKNFPKSYEEIIYDLKEGLSKYNLETPSIQKESNKKIKNILKKQKENPNSILEYNEILILNPQVSGAYYAIDYGYLTLSEDELFKNIEASYYRELSSEEIIKVKKKIKVNKKKAFKIFINDLIESMNIVNNDINLPFYLISPDKNFLLTTNGRIEVKRSDIRNNSIGMTNNKKISFIEENKDLYLGDHMQKELQQIKKNIINNKNLREEIIIDKFPNFKEIQIELQTILNLLTDFDKYSNKDSSKFIEKLKGKTKKEAFLIIKENFYKIITDLDLLKNFTKDFIPEEEFYEAFFNEFNKIKLIIEEQK